jgi:hypothetical protein
MTEAFDPCQTAAFEPVTPDQVAAASAAPATPAATVDEDGDAALTRRPVVPAAPAGAAPGFFKRLFSDADGRLNRKSVALAAGAAALALALLLSGGQPAPDAAPKKPTPAPDAPRSANVARQLVSGAPESALAAGAAPNPPGLAKPPVPPPASAAASPFTAPPGATAPPAAGGASGASAPKSKPAPTANPAPAPDASAQPTRSFVIPLRDAARTGEGRSPVAKSAASAAADGADAPQPPPLPRGTRISLRLLEPVVTGAAAPAAAIVLEDVFGEDGSIVIPKGTRAEIPFLGYDANGRIPNNRAQPAVFLVPDVPGGLSAKGGVKGADGRAGVAGLVTQERPGFLKRMLGASARVGSAAVGGLGPGDAAGEVERAAGVDSVATISPAGRRVVEVAKGTPFTFIVGF